MIPEAFADRLERLRLERYMTLVQLADASGVSDSYISRLEAGTREPSLEAIRALASGLGVTPDHLETGVADEVAARVAVDRIDAAAEQFGVPLRWRDLDDDERRAVLAGLDVALLDSVVGRLYAAHRARQRVA